MGGNILRIGLRYGIGALVGAGWLSSEVGGQISTDPDVIALVDWAGFAIGAAVVEGYYYLAKRYGWAT